jgi:hypothetical protein
MLRSSIHSRLKGRQGPSGIQTRRDVKQSYSPLAHARRSRLPREMRCRAATPRAIAAATLGKAARHQKKRALGAMRQRLADVPKDTVVKAVGMVAANND